MFLHNKGKNLHYQARRYSLGPAMHLHTVKSTVWLTQPFYVFYDIEEDTLIQSHNEFDSKIFILVGMSFLIESII